MGVVGTTKTWKEWPLWWGGGWNCKRVLSMEQLKKRRRWFIKETITPPFWSMERKHRACGACTVAQYGIVEVLGTFISRRVLWNVFQRKCSSFLTFSIIFFHFDLFRTTWLNAARTVSVQEVMLTLYCLKHLQNLVRFGQRTSNPLTLSVAS